MNGDGGLAAATFVYGPSCLCLGLDTKDQWDRSGPLLFRKKIAGMSNSLLGVAIQSIQPASCPSIPLLCLYAAPLRSLLRALTNA